MPAPASRKLFVNLAVEDLARSKRFFSSLGFEFDARFTDDKAACLVIGPDVAVMLLSRPFFRTFTSRDVCDTRTHTEALLAITCRSRAEVDDLSRKAIAAGGKSATEPVDHGFMYTKAFYDPDGHHWEPFWMDPDALEKGPLSDTSRARSSS